MEILTSLHGRQAGLGSTLVNAKDQSLVVPGGHVSGRHGSQLFHAAPNIVSAWDDFTGAALSSYWTSHKGSDGGTVDWTINAQVSGVARGVTGAGGTTTMAVNGIQIDGALNWQANQGGLAFEARVRSVLITSLCLYVGLTNQRASLQMPINSAGSANTLTYNAADAVGFLYDTANTDAVWFLTGNANSVAATTQVLSAANLLSGVAIAPVANTFAVFRIEIDTSGNAAFFYNGNPVGTRMTSAVTASTPLTPVIAAFRRTGTITQIEADYVHVAAVRT